MTIVPRWEWRVFGDSFGSAEDVFAALEPERVDEDDDIYVLSRGSDASVKLRDGRADVKRLLRVGDEGLEQWMPVLKAAFPLTAAEVRTVLEALRVDVPPLARGEYTLPEVNEELVDAGLDLMGLRVRKRRVRYTLGGCMAELTEIRTDAGSTRTIAIESEDPALVSAAVAELGLSSRRVVCMARGLKVLAGFGARRYAVVDVGTNSVKFHVAELGADGAWRAVVDRAEVTRLGEGVDDTGRLGSEPIDRTVAAIAAMVHEADRDGAEAIAAVGTAGLRIAENAALFLDAVRARAGVEVEVISAEDERRLAHLAAKAGIGLAGGSLVVFDTGGGSSQFTFEGAAGAGERFSVNVGAVTTTERYGLAGVVSDDALAAALAGIAGDLARLEGRPAPDAVVGMGGAVTNLAAVKHGLESYDPDVVQGTVLDRAEIDRQIELYRTRRADERRAIVGLQPGRAEVILAGACIVRTVLERLGRESLTVSDRGLRHGLLAERFGG
jgi:exopolyphosphatase / guanosine-5'-triphosphate,3'-diphosphate pyrophosphatase